MVKTAQVMTIIVHPEDENSITTLSSNIEGPITYYENEITFLKNALERLEKKSEDLRNHDQ